MTAARAKLHPRTAGLLASATLAINERSRELQESGREIFRFGLGQSPFPVPRSVVQALRDNADQKDYLPVRGLLPLREAVADWFKRRADLDFAARDVLIAPGSKELLFLIQMALDASLILPSPSWVSYHPQSRIAGNPAIWIDTREDEGWRLTPGALNAACAETLGGRAGLLLLNYPNNPTGTSYTPEQLRDLAEAARQLGLLVISDEIYGEVDHRGKHRSIAGFYPEGTLITTGLSKWCGAGGWRLGVAAFPRELTALADVVANMASETYTSASAPIQYAAIAAFREHADLDNYLENSRQVLGHVQRYVRERLLARGVSAPEGTGGFYLFCNFEHFRAALSRRAIETSDALAESLLLETGFAALPGTAFGRAPGELLLRLSYVDFDGEAALQRAQELADPRVFAALCPKIVRAMDALTAWLEELVA